jgi:voltage-gated potassium channel
VSGAVLQGRRRQVLRSRVSRLRAAHSYRSVLLLIGVAFVFAALAGDAHWTTAVLLLLMSLTLATAVWTSGLARRDSRLIIGLLTSATLVAVALLASGSERLVGVAGLVSGVLVAATIIVIGIGVVDQDEVNAQSVTGAICAYVLFGLLFLFLYGAVAVLGSGDFFEQGTDGTRSLRLYFSYVTLATLGYGDYTPATELGRLLAVFEALFGQLYLVTVLALLVSQLRGRRNG